MAVLLPSSEISSFSVGRRPAGIFCDTKLRNSHKVAIINTGKEIVKARIHSRVKDIEEAARGLSLGFNVGLCNSFSAMAEPATSSPSTKPSKEEEQKRDYYLNMGDAIRAIREDFPALFYRELSFDIYRDDIVFKDPVNTFVGIENYKSIFWALRFHGRMFFRALWIDIASVWQPVDSMIMVRWTVHGIPRVPWESRGRFDGTSEYKLDKNGKIYEHKVHNIVLNAPPKFYVVAFEEIVQYITCPSMPKPTSFESSTCSPMIITEKNCRGQHILEQYVFLV